MKLSIKILYILGLVIVAGGVFFAIKHSKNKTTSQTVNYVNQQPQGEVVISSPTSNQEINSPLQISGKAKGNWFFEASFPVKVVDEDGTVLGQGQAKAQGDWQTQDYVNFTASLLFQNPKGKTGNLIFMNDNPSGLLENQKEFIVPVKFNQQTSVLPPPGTCSPNNAACAGDPQLCLEDSLNKACN